MGATIAAEPEPQTAPRGGRAARPGGYLEVALLAGTGAMLLQKVVGGVLIFYLHPRYTWVAVAAGLGFVLVAGARLQQVRAGGDYPPRHRGGYLLLALPVLLGLLVPAQPLAWSSAAQAAPSVNDTPYADPPPTGDTRDWNIYQWRTALRASEGAPQEFQGREADVVGFARHNPQYSFDGFFAARLVIVHCVVDAVPTNLPVLWPGGAALAPDTWVHVRGRLGTVTLNGQTYPALVAEAVEPVPQPSDPYLFR